MTVKGLHYILLVLSPIFDAYLCLLSTHDTMQISTGGYHTQCVPMWK